MTITNAQARTKYGGPIRDAYAAALVFRQLTNRNLEGDIETAYSLRLNTTRLTANVTETDRDTTRNPALPAQETSTVVNDTLTMQYTAQHGVYETNLDLLEGPPDTLPVVLREQSYKLAAKADARIRTILTAGIPDANDAENTAGLRFGEAQSYIDDNGEPAGTTGSITAESRLKYVIDAIRRAGHLYRSKNYWKLGDPNFDIRTPYALIPNALATAIGNYILVAKPSDNLVEEFLRDDGVSPTGVMGAIGGVPIIVTNELPKFTVGTTDYHSVLITNPAAITAAFRTPDLAINGASRGEQPIPRGNRRKRL